MSRLSGCSSWHSPAASNWKCEVIKVYFIFRAPESTFAGASRGFSHLLFTLCLCGRAGNTSLLCPSPHLFFPITVDSVTWSDKRVQCCCFSGFTRLWPDLISLGGCHWNCVFCVFLGSFRKTRFVTVRACVWQCHTIVGISLSLPSPLLFLSPHPPACVPTAQQ